MADVQRIVLVDPQDETREQIRKVLLGEQTIWLEAECRDYNAFLEVVDQTSPDVAIIAIDSDSQAALHLIQSLTTSAPTANLLAVSAQTDGRFILDLLRRGVKEFVGLPLQAFELTDALSRLGGGGGGLKRESKVYAFLGARGGVGCTSLAVNCGCILAQDQAKSVALLDLDLVLGDADVCLDIIPDYTLIDLALNIDNVDQMLVKRALSRHSSGLHVLPHPVKIEDATSIRADHVERVVNLLKRTFSHILIDCSKGYLPTDFAAMNLADEMLMVIQLDVSSLHNVLRFNKLISDRPGLADKMKVIANRVGSDGEISIQKAEETIEKPVFFQLPNESRTMFASRNKGVPLLEFAPKSKLFLSILSMTNELIDIEVNHAPAKDKDPRSKTKRSFFFG